MHLEVLNNDQKALLPILAKFKKEYYMVGGTAIALYLGHRYSIDFDLFKNGDIRTKTIFPKFEILKEKYAITLNRSGQLNLLCRNVKFTFFDFEFDVPHDIPILNFINIPTLLDLAAMKAYALGRRSKWKDYLDLYFILKSDFSLKEICHRASEIFGDMFSAKLFVGQLSYFDGINYSEEVEFITGFEVSDEEIKAYLVGKALEAF